MITTVTDILRELKTATASMSEARRMIFEGAVSLNGTVVHAVHAYGEIEVVEGDVLKIGKKRRWTFDGKSWIKVIS